MSDCNFRDSTTSLDSGLDIMGLVRGQIKHAESFCLVTFWSMRKSHRVGRLHTSDLRVFDGCFELMGEVFDSVDDDAFFSSAG